MKAIKIKFIAAYNLAFFVDELKLKYGCLHLTGDVLLCQFQYSKTLQFQYQKKQKQKQILGLVNKSSVSVIQKHSRQLPLRHDRARDQKK